MTVKTGMLPGDEFSLAEWRAAKGQPSTAPEELPVSVRLAYEQLLDACQRTGVPHMAVFATKGAINLRYDILDNPSSVPADMLTARATASGNIQHQMGLMAIAFENLDLSKLNGL